MHLYEGGLPKVKISGIRTAIEKRSLMFLIGCFWIALVSVSCGSKVDPSLMSASLVGAWNVQSYNNGANGEAGFITFAEDGTYSFTGIITVSPNGCWLTACTSYKGTWRVDSSSLIFLTASGGYSSYLNVSNWDATQFTATSGFDTSVFTKAVATQTATQEYLRSE